jgi:cytochrome d ubiquinol oxidase subunit II
MHAIGPFLHGNEVWLIAGGGALFALFPKAYASAFSGFYLPFMIVLWLLMFRGISIELRKHFPTRIWHDFWDFCFTGSSTLLILLFGVALGNLLRGVPLDAHGYFTGTFAYLLNPYAIGVGLFAILALALHGALFIKLRLDGAPSERATRLALPLWWAVLIAYIIVTFTTFAVRPTVALQPIAATLPTANYGTEIAGVLIFFSLAALVTSRIAIARNAIQVAFIASCVFLGTLLVAAAATLYPYLLPSFPRGNGISIFDASPGAASSISALVAIILGLCITLAYAGIAFPRFFKKIQP